MKISVVIPAYNEEKDIMGAIMDVVRAFDNKAEIIVVDDCSTDRTSGKLRKMAFYNKKIKVITNKTNRGHGYSVVRGLKAAKGDYILYIDADRQIDIDRFDFYHLGGMDIVSGWRRGRQDKLFRKFISKTLKLVNLFWHHMRIKDANCPYKLYKRSTIQPLLDELPKSYIVPIASLEVIARKHDLMIATIPVDHKPYSGVRKGFLQAIDLKTIKFFINAFREVVSL